jgi:hypothetical protein
MWQQIFEMAIKLILVGLVMFLILRVAQLEAMIKQRDLPDPRSPTPRAADQSEQKAAKCWKCKVEIVNGYCRNATCSEFHP